jgi:Ser/Thr protein kinase RdoA (MazF antagonist)
MARGSRYCTLFSWAPGRPRGRDLDGEAASTVGRTLATIHVAADGYVSRFPRYSLDEHTLLDRPLRLMEPTLRRDSVADARFIREQAEEIRVRLRSFGQGDGRWGVIHGDVQVLNYHLTAGGDITFFDFDLCGYGWRLYDIASYVTRIPPNAREPVLHGYESVLPLSEQDREFLPTFGRLAWIREGLQSKDLVKKLGDPNMSSGF